MSQTHAQNSSSTASNTGPRTAEVNGEGVRGWVRSAKGGLAHGHSAGEDSVAADLRYETPEEIRVKKRLENDALQKEEKAEKVAAHEAILDIIRDCSGSDRTPTSSELQKIAGTSFRDGSSYMELAQASLASREILKQNPTAAFVAFEEIEAFYDNGRGGKSRTLSRRAVVLDAGFFPISETTTFGGYTFDSDDMPLEGHLANVFPETIDYFDPDRSFDEDFHSQMKMTNAARSFNDGSHPNVPNLLTVNAASTWVPAPIPVPRQRKTGQTEGGVELEPASKLSTFFGRMFSR